LKRTAKIKSERSANHDAFFRSTDFSSYRSLVRDHVPPIFPRNGARNQNRHSKDLKESHSKDLNESDSEKTKKGPTLGRHNGGGKTITQGQLNDSLERAT